MNDTNKKNVNDLKGLLQPAFVVCVAVLLLAAGGLAVTGRAKVQKDALPLRKALSELDEKAIAPYRVVNRARITSEDELKALGTVEYIKWVLEDTSVEPTSPSRYVSLLVTFYTGKTLDAVVHTPEACYLGGGNQPGEAYNEDMTIDAYVEGAKVSRKLQIPVRCATFRKGSTQAWENEATFTVMYTFKVNGTYKDSRTATRAELGGVSKYAYYAKVEWQFFGHGGIGGGQIYPSKEETTKASGKLLSVVLGELERSHWPEWTVAEKEGEQTAGRR
jgi:hypothetical protein